LLGALIKVPLIDFLSKKTLFLIYFLKYSFVTILSIHLLHKLKDTFFPFNKALTICMAYNGFTFTNVQQNIKFILVTIVFGIQQLFFQLFISMVKKVLCFRLIGPFP
jgi:hypothetical protein